jgi:hypothetical protein
MRVPQFQFQTFNTSLFSNLTTVVNFFRCGNRRKSLGRHETWASHHYWTADAQNPLEANIIYWFIQLTYSCWRVTCAWDLSRSVFLLFLSRIAVHAKWTTWRLASSQSDRSRHNGIQLPQPFFHGSSPLSLCLDLPESAIGLRGVSSAWNWHFPIFTDQSTPLHIYTRR